MGSRPGCRPGRFLTQCWLLWLLIGAGSFLALFCPSPLISSAQSTGSEPRLQVLEKYSHHVQPSVPPTSARTEPWPEAGRHQGPSKLQEEAWPPALARCGLSERRRLSFSADRALLLQGTFRVQTAGSQPRARTPPHLNPRTPIGEGALAADWEGNPRATGLSVPAGWVGTVRTVAHHVTFLLLFHSL